MRLVAQRQSPTLGFLIGGMLVAAGGKGSRNIRPTSERATVVDDFTNVKIEVIVNDMAMGEAIMERLAEAYFENYPGIIYMEDIMVLRPKKFDKGE